MGTGAVARTQKTTLISLAVLTTVVVVAVAGMVLAERSLKWNLEEQAQASARQWAETFLIKSDLIDPILSGEPLSSNTIDYIETISNVGRIFEFKILDRSGRLLLVSDELERTGHFSPEPYRPGVAERLARGESVGYSSIYENKPNKPDVYFSAYVPFVRDGNVEAVVETYVDVTDTYAALRLKSYVNASILAALVVLSIAHAMYTLSLLRRQRAATRTIFELSRRDPLTGLANRTRFSEALRWSAPRQHPQSASCWWISMGSRR